MTNWYDGLSLSGKTALVTGGSRGIGRAICITLAERGAAVAVNYRSSREEAESVVAEIVRQGGKAVAIAADLAQPDTARTLVNTTRHELGAVDILVNNAGAMTDVDVANMPDDDWDLVLATNLGGAFRCARASIPPMKQQGWGRIINITSQAAYTGSRYHAHYAASKAGLRGLTFSLAKELATAGITVNLVAPGRITTEMLLSRSEGRMEEWLKQIPLDRLGSPEEVATAAAFLASEDARYITGATLHVNGGMVMD